MKHILVIQHGNLRNANEYYCHTLNTLLQLPGTIYTPPISPLYNNSDISNSTPPQSESDKSFSATFLDDYMV